MAVVGVLALQGDFEKHTQIVDKLGFTALLIKDAKSLDKCDRLIIPGGESTTFLKLIDRLELRDPLVEFGKMKPVFGTCAGLIILANHVRNDTFQTLGLIDLTASRNAYGRQINSFYDEVSLTFDKNKPFEAIFIRAPKILDCHGSVKPLAYHNDDIVMAANENILVASFHPELTDDLRIHDFFLNHFA